MRAQKEMNGLAIKEAKQLYKKVSVRAKHLEKKAQEWTREGYAQANFRAAGFYAQAQKYCAGEDGELEKLEAVNHRRMVELARHYKEQDPKKYAENIAALDEELNRMEEQWKSSSYSFDLAEQARSEYEKKVQEWGAILTGLQNKEGAESTAFLEKCRSIEDSTNKRTDVAIQRIEGYINALRTATVSKEQSDEEFHNLKLRMDQMKGDIEKKPSKEDVALQISKGFSSYGSV